MIITSGEVGMASRRDYFTKTNSFTRITTSGSNNAGGIRGLSNAGFSGNFLGFLNYSLEELKQNTDINKESGLLGTITDGDGKSSASRGVTQTQDATELRKSALRIQFETLQYLFRILFQERFQQERSSFEKFPYGEESGQGNVGFSTTTETYENMYTYEENETTTFSTQGTVRTADGREIGFGIDVTMSRSFYEQYTTKYTRAVPNYLDPLVINLDGNVTNITDQKFFFDLDCDGKEDEISTLGSGSGFLALDKNGDGVINDGSELFGAKSGNGFHELATFDLDGNGWIDEADEIFDHLKVWTKDDEGKDVLFTLKEAGVGAICLQAQRTPFNITDENNESKAMVRQSGFYLKENGVPGLMQQVDMAM